MMKLENEAQQLAANFGQLAVRQLAQVLAGQHNPPSSRSIEAPQEVQKSALAGSRSANNPHRLAGLHLQIYAPQHYQRASTARILLVQAMPNQHWTFGLVVMSITHIE
jgi:hypothetical protein